MSRTYAELAALTSRCSGAVPPSTARYARRRARSPQYKGYKAAVGMFTALSACLLAGVEITDPDENPVRALVVWALFTAFCALLVGGLLLLHSLLDKHAAGPLPPVRGPRGPAAKASSPAGSVLLRLRPEPWVRCPLPGGVPRHRLAYGPYWTACNRPSSHVRQRLVAG